MRPFWSGAISFGLIYIPVKLYKATDERRLDLDMLRKDDLCPIQYVRVCKEDREPVSYEDIVKGYEYEDGEYVVLEEEDFDKIYAEEKDAVDIKEFVLEKEIDSKYFEKPYYLEPEKAAMKAYNLLVRALKKSKKVGITEYVLHKIQHLGIIKAEGNLLVLNQLRYDSQFRKADDLNIDTSKRISKDDMDMAVKLIDQMTKEYKPSKYKDTYSQKLYSAIEEKAEKGKITAPKVKKKRTEVIDLSAKLKKSLQKTKKKSAS